MKKLGAICAATALLATAGCGNSRPSADDISSALQKGVKSTKGGPAVKLKKKQADCVAKAFVGSKLSDAALQQMVDKHTYAQTTTNNKALQAVASQISKCQA